MAGKRVEKRIATTSIDRPHPTEVAVQLAAIEQIGEGQLVHDR